MKAFSTKIYIIGVNPYVLLPASVLKYLFQKAGKDKGAIPVKGKLNGKSFIQNLVKYSGKWRLYLNGPMRQTVGIDVGDIAPVEINFDPKPREVPMHPKLKKALQQNTKAKAAFNKLSPSRQKEILKYINFLKSEESVDKNVARAIAHLVSAKPFIGQQKGKFIYYGCREVDTNFIYKRDAGDS